MRRKWFRDKDGSFYRNVPLVQSDIKRSWWMPWRLPRLDAEWDVVWREGLIRKDSLGWFDVEVEPLPFRVAYPEHPILWKLDGSDG